MCPVCLATMGLYVAGGVSAGGITTYLATRWLHRRSDQDGGDRLRGLQAREGRDSGARQGARRMEA